MGKIISNKKADELRKRFINTFVDTESDYYLKNIKSVKPTDVQYNTYRCAYLRDTLKKYIYSVVTFEKAVEIAEEKKRVYTMWDVHPMPVFTDGTTPFMKPNYLNVYQSDTVIEWDADELTELIKKELGDYEKTDNQTNTLPEDLYVFDDSMEWCVILTHSPVSFSEWVNGVRQPEERLCLYCSTHL